MTSPEPPSGGPLPGSVPPPYNADPYSTSAMTAPRPQGAGGPPSGAAKGLAVGALVVGIAAFLFGLIPVFGAVVGIVAVVLGVIAVRRHQPKGLAVTGLVLGGIAVLSSVGTAAGLGAAVNSAGVDKPAVVAESSAPTPTDVPSAEPSQASSAAAAAPAAAPADEPSEAASEEPSVPVEYLSALTKADSYANIMHMSKAGLYDQLTSQYGEKFSAEAAQYAVDHVQADWNANALAKAKEYQANMAMSPAAIHDQLTSTYGEKFTPAEADYAIQHLND